MEGILTLRKAAWPEPINIEIQGPSIEKLIQLAAYQATIATGDFVPAGQFAFSEANYESIHYQAQDLTFDEEHGKMLGWHIGLSISLSIKFIDKVRLLMEAQLTAPGTVAGLIPRFKYERIMEED